MNLPLNDVDKLYHELVDEVLNEGQQKGDRTGTGTKAVVGRMAHFNLMNRRVPRLTTKPIIGDNPEEEMFWFISGDTNIKVLRDKGIGIWNSWLIPGTATHRPCTVSELEKRLIKYFTPDSGYAAIGYYAMSAEEAADLGRDARYDINRRPKTPQVTLWFHPELWAKFEQDANANHRPFNLVVYEWVCKDQKISTDYLTGGDIGKGGYGAQWRHWEDTQIINKSELDEYLAQGYKCITVIHEDYAGYEYAGKLVVYRKVDQLQNAIDLLKNNADSRRIIVSAWNPALTWKAALPPCHLYFQFISHELTVMQRIRIFNDRTMLCQRDHMLSKEQSFVSWETLNEAEFAFAVAQASPSELEQLHVDLDNRGVKRRNVNCFLLLRSNDLGLGMPFNITQYAALTHMVAQVVGMEPGELVWAAVDAHVYNDHVAGLTEQLQRGSTDCIPRLKLDKRVTNIDDFDITKMEVVDYVSQPPLINKMLPSV